MAHKKILIAQMTRMGDVLQTSPLTRALKQRYPDAHITVMVRRMGKAVAECNPDVDDILIYEEDELFLDLKSEDADRLLKSYHQTEAYIDQLRAGEYDIAYNCTHSLCSAMLLKLAGIPEVVGAHLSDDWRYVWRGRGPNYFITSVLHREANDLNICDSFRYFMQDPPATNGLVFEVSNSAIAEAQSLLSSCGIADDSPMICLQLGASDRDKRWPVAQFANLAAALNAQHKARILLLGVAEEAALGAEFEQIKPGLATHLFGKTTIPQLAAVLKRSAVLVTNDTGTMHIAAAVRCPVVLVSVGYVHFRETGPYGSGNFALEVTRHDLGRSDLRGRDTGAVGITWEHVRLVVDSIIDAEFDPKTFESRFENVDLFGSEFAPDGCLQWYPVIPREATNSDIIRLAYRCMWLEDFNGKINHDIVEASLKRFLAHYRAQPETVSWDMLSDSLASAGAIARRGAAITKILLETLGKPGGLREAKQQVATLMGIDEELRVFAEIHPVCRPIVATARFERENLEGADPAQLTRRTLEIYNSINLRAEGVIRYLELIRCSLNP